MKVQLNLLPYTIDVVKQINVPGTGSMSSLMKSGSESSLSEENVKSSVDRQKSNDSSTKEWRSEQQDEKETCSDTEECAPPVAPARRRRSRVHGGFRKSEGGNSAECASIDVDDGSGMRTSKSDTSLTDSFVMISEAKKKPINPLNPLRPGFKWQRQLVFRSKLTMHTAYDRKDNAEPASVTASAVSKDHRCVYVGDTGGRVFSWSVCDIPGRAADHWLKDEGADYCAGCSNKFTIYERKHHCRNCRQVFCSKCIKFECEISRLRILKPVRVCQSCYAALKAER